MRQHNWRQTFFYAVEMTFAAIGGAGEAYIYWAYLPDSPFRIYEAVARAVITQVAIVFFGVAAVQATRSVHGGFGRKFVAALPANIATAIASLVAFWFMRDAAIIFRDTTFLAPAESGGIGLPNGAFVPGMWIDIYLIAALPFFQVGLNWLAPIIVSDATVETAEQRQERYASELAEAEHKRVLRARTGGGIGSFIAANIQAAKTGLSGDISSTTNTGIDAGLEAAMLDIASTTNSGDTPPIDAQDDGGKAGGTKRRKAGVSSVPSDMMSAPQFRQYLAQNGVRISPEKSVAYVQSIQGYDKVGTMFCARKGPLMKLANRLIDRAHTTGNADDEAQAKGA